MINFNHNAISLKEAFNITQEDVDLFDEITKTLNVVERKVPVSFAAQRIWIDERLSDNAKAYALFTLGRFYEFWHFLRDIPGTEN